MEEARNATCIDCEDRISRLQDELIHHIMSFIDTKLAVQTCVLSKRWIHTWKSLPFLNFSRSSFSEDKKDSFIMFVDMVLILHRDFDIVRFNVNWEDSAYYKRVTMHVNRWSLHAVQYNVQEISIIITQCHNSSYEIPHCLLNCKSLKKLEIMVFRDVVNATYADIVLPRSMSLPQLKVLRFIGLSISNVESSKRLFSSCPVLESLHIIECDIQTDDERKLIVDSLSLKKFDYSHCYRNISPGDDTMTSVVKLCAPNLEDFTCRSFLTQNYLLENCSPLSGVSLHMKLNAKENYENAKAYSELPSMEKEVYAKRIVKFLGVVHMVKILSLSPGFLEVLSQAPHILDYQPPRLCNLHCLEIQLWSTRCCFRALAYLFKISPNINTIIIRYKESNLVDVGDDRDAGLASPGILSHLEYIQVEEVDGCDAEIKLLSFVLKNAEVLEEIAVYFRSSVCTPARVRQVEQFKDNLRAVPTASSSVEIAFY